MENKKINIAAGEPTQPKGMSPFEAVMEIDNFIFESVMNVGGEKVE